ncbi:MAG TPA: 2-amino-4-hydroxy-6-hydroxymethyldihydropteridine diphosphokinase [Thermodesulforhabdus norvegica]|uniref:2-amino-4-hydroxy-6-hydroxymethyldihydropteridine pyrophosphokinase n=1 Tax=Thermodesulforhabdus norvegica TaxID=39841 RepID=A0A7C0WU92_9BACT|nr:2-amino-4-hydroxy-6-hydroxymethyldihydropteridine diphosphokinase [Deltaproteobacteria bacterium]MBW2069247.1 2-amino-4-hydroxy-6-hydroxymethyldihydropteridine diphosphokinase [Deltaproteobacteria bacterium]HDL89655.1 2-amino-4-hydroxy-6-hydroxymethyldihydropteridine diphosphokinase [Thermodesulforhabdus norvegica]
MKKLENVFLSIGSNLGNALRNCESAVQRIADVEHFEVVEVSPWYRTEPVGFKKQPWFVNGVIWGVTNLEPVKLLEAIQAVENSMGRERTIKWGPRTIDIDILFYGNKRVNMENLVIPHPELHKRRFVLVPLCDLAPHWIHPEFGVSVKELLAGVSPDGQDLKRIE